MILVIMVNLEGVKMCYILCANLQVFGKDVAKTSY